MEYDLGWDSGYCYEKTFHRWNLKHSYWYLTNEKEPKSGIVQRSNTCSNIQPVTTDQLSEVRLFLQASQEKRQRREYVMNNLLKGQDQINQSDRWTGALSSAPDKLDLH